MTQLTPRQWLLTRLDDPPQVYVARHQGAWQILLRIDGGYGARNDAADVARLLGPEIRALLDTVKQC